VPAMRVLTVVRDAVQRGIEPLQAGGLLALVVRQVTAGCEVTVTAGAGESTTLLLPTAADRRAQI